MWSTGVQVERTPHLVTPGYPLPPSAVYNSLTACIACLTECTQLNFYPINGLVDDKKKRITYISNFNAYHAACIQNAMKPAC